MGARTPERRQFLPYRGGPGLPRRRPDLRRPARSRRSPWLSSYRPHRRPPFQRRRLHHNQLVPSPLPSRFPSTARLLLNYLQASRVSPAGLILSLPRPSASVASFTLSYSPVASPAAFRPLRGFY